MPTTLASLTAQITTLGIQSGDIVMVHAALRTLGPILGGADTLITALQSVTGPSGTLMAYTDWDAQEELWRDGDGNVIPAMRPHVIPFDPQRSRSIRDNGWLPEALRTTPGALRSGNSGASVAALGAHARHLTENHPLDQGYGHRSPLAKLVALNGKILMAAAPLDTMTLLHHAEFLAQIPDKRLLRREVPMPNGWRWTEEFDTGDPVSPRLPEDFIAQIAEAFLASGQGRTGPLGTGTATLVEAQAILPFAIRWIEAQAG